MILVICYTSSDSKQQILFDMEWSVEREELENTVEVIFSFINGVK